MEVPAPFAGRIMSLSGEPGAKLKVGQAILTYQPPGSKADVPAPVAQRAVSAPAMAAAPATKRAANGNLSPGGPIPLAAPSVRPRARKRGIDLSGVRGPGPAGRILTDDLSAQIARPDGAEKARRAEPVADYGRPGTRIKLHGLRRKIAEHMLDAKRRIPHYSYVDECDVSELVRLRHALRGPSAEHGIKLTSLPFFVKAVAEALKDVPIVNSSLNDETEEIVLHDRYDIGIAVATPGGLIVPVVRDVDKKDLFTVAAEAERLG